MMKDTERLGKGTLKNSAMDPAGGKLYHKKAMAKFNKWETVPVYTPNGAFDAAAPLVVSASRSTDIPAFFQEWFIRRLEAGYVCWTNPFNRRKLYIDLAHARAFVFWTKNAEPFFNALDVLDRKKLGYYFQFTLNDYEKENLEPGVPAIGKRIETFKNLSCRLGKGRVIWRFDPLILAGGLTIDALLDRIHRLGDLVHEYTEKLVFSFVQVSRYRKVLHNMRREGVQWRDFTPSEARGLVERLVQLCRQWGLTALACAEEEWVGDAGADPSKCIDGDLLARLYPGDKVLMEFFQENGPKLKDPGQRKNCHCIPSKDIGAYNTCRHLCRYCYANSSKGLVEKNVASHSDDGEGIIDKKP